MIARRVALSLISAAVAAACSPASNAMFPLGGSAAASAIVFDYYIAPNGDDNNAGTLESPWSITALNSKQSTYAGKTIGIIGDVSGTQTPIQYGTVGGVQTTLYSLMQASTSGVVLQVNGGTASSQTWLASCTSTGIYQRQWAIIDASQPGTGDLPTGATSIIMGQAFYDTTPPPNVGYVTLDGLIVRNGVFACVQFGDIQDTQLQGIIVQNCEIYNCVCSTSAENPGGLFLGNTSGAQVLNCLLHDCLNSGGDYVPGTGGITTYTAVGLIVTNCTFYRNGYAIQNKDGYQYGTYSYNYMDVGQLGSYTGEADACAIKSTIPNTGQTLTVHHNIIVGGGYYGYGADGDTIKGGTVFHHNTHYTPSSVSAGASADWFYAASGATAPQWYDNLVYFEAYQTNQGNPYGCLSFVTVSPSECDYNYYGTGMNWGNLTTNYTTLSSWQGQGFDTHSAQGGSPFASTPTFRTPSSFAVTGTAATLSSTGGPVGALDGTGTVGSSLTPSS